MQAPGFLLRTARRQGLTLLLLLPSGNKCPLRRGDSADPAQMPYQEEHPVQGATKVASRNHHPGERQHGQACEI